MKYIPIPSASAYKKRLIEKMELVIKRMIWRLFFFRQGQDEQDDSANENFGFKSRKCPPPHVEELQPFEDDLLRTVEDIQFRRTSDTFQDQLQKDIKMVRTSEKLFVQAD